MSASMHDQRPPVLDRICLDRHAVIEASAGTGKTYTLEHLVVELLVTSAATLEQILVVTFTEKAANELRARLRKRLRAYTAPDQSITAEVFEKVDSALASFDRASISTIHAFCQRMLREQAFNHRQAFDQVLVDGRAAFSEAFVDRLRSRFAREEPWRTFLRSWLDRGTVDDLEALLFACHARKGTFARRLDLKALTSAVADLRGLDLAPHALRPALLRVNVHPSTTKAILERIATLRSIFDRTELPRDAGWVLFELDRLEHARETGCLRFLCDRLEGVSPAGTLLARLHASLRALGDVTIPFSEALADLFLPEIVTSAQRSKAARGELDFDDMLTLLEACLRDDSGLKVLNSIRARYRFALIDEFQDTDETQWSIFRHVFLKDSTDHTLFVIGDPKQAIYGFRGADVRTYLEACGAIMRSGGQRVRLDENHRSTPALVAALNIVFDQTAPAPFFTGEVARHEPVTSAKGGVVELLIDGKAVHPIHILRLTSPEGRLSGRAARRGLAERIAHEIRELLAAEVEVVSPGKTRRLGPEDVFVLTRSALEGLEVAAHLRAAGIPHAFYKQDGLFETREAKDVLSLLTAIQDPGSRAGRLVAWQTPFFAVPVSRLWDGLEVPFEHPLFRELLAWKELADAKQYARLFSRILDDTRLIERALFLGGGEREITNYLHIFELLLGETTRTRTPLSRLIRTLTAYVRGHRVPPGEDGNVQRLETDRASVQLMTMHKSKGLEASVVFLFGGFDAPKSDVHVYHENGVRRLALGTDRPASVEREQKEEDQRLLYVAMTRARARLYLPYFGPKETIPDRDARLEQELVRLDGPHRVLNDRLDSMLAEGPDPALFRVETVVVGPSVARPTTTATDEPKAMWVPPPELLGELRGRHPDVPRRERSGAVHRGHPGVLPTEVVTPRAPGRSHPSSSHHHDELVVTSYSRLKALRGGHTLPEALVEPFDEGAQDLAPRSLEPSSAQLEHDLQKPDDGARPNLEPMGIDPMIPEAERLPSGPAFGRLVHELLERVPLDKLRTSAGYEVFRHDPEVHTLFERATDRHAQPRTQIEGLKKLVFTAMTTPISLGPHRLEHGFLGCRALVREMEFLFPVWNEAITERREHTGPDDPGRGDSRERSRLGLLRGFMKGFIDLVVESEGRCFLIDWKSDLLPTYDEAVLREHFEHNYRLQADLYALALKKHLGLGDREAYEARFGGVGYCFVRGMGVTSASADHRASSGTLFVRPSWEDLRSAEEELQDSALA